LSELRREMLCMRHSLIINYCDSELTYEATEAATVANPLADLEDAPRCVFALMKHCSESCSTKIIDSHIDEQVSPLRIAVYKSSRTTS
jgi:hypothetical protein